MRAMLVVGILALLACNKSKGSGRPDECKVVADHLTALQADNSRNLPEPQRAKFMSVMNKIGDAVTINCREMRWSAEVTSCLKTIKALSEGGACQAKMTAEQKSSVDKVVADTQVDAMKDMKAAGGSGAATMEGSAAATASGPKQLELDTTRSGAAKASASGSAAAIGVTASGSAAVSGSAAASGSAPGAASK